MVNVVVGITLACDRLLLLEKLWETPTLPPSDVGIEWTAVCSFYAREERYTGVSPCDPCTPRRTPIDLRRSLESGEDSLLALFCYKHISGAASVDGPQDSQQVSS